MSNALMKARQCFSAIQAVVNNPELTTSERKALIDQLDRRRLEFYLEHHLADPPGNTCVCVNGPIKADGSMTLVSVEEWVLYANHLAALTGADEPIIVKKAALTKEGSINE